VRDDLPPLPPDIEALISGVAQLTVDYIPPANSPDDYGTTHPGLRTSPTLFLMRERWMRSLLASGETPTFKMIGICLAMHLNVASGRCDPSHKRIAGQVGGISRSTVIRALASLRNAGWIDVPETSRGRGKTSNFSLKLPGTGW
jgi:hypothetical protein